ncbi:hypothetical protein Tco_0651798 [Tanacetum coccineum]|uniref:Uncharacterized protein n=1 Tax=Tanacetum coccineum TaxID=301880 RepID=A0ABQ4WVT0_9ASTR
MASTTGKKCLAFQVLDTSFIQQQMGTCFITGGYATRIDEHSLVSECTVRWLLVLPGLQVNVVSYVQCWTTDAFGSRIDDAIIDRFGDYYEES